MLRYKEHGRYNHWAYEDENLTRTITLSSSIFLKTTTTP